MRILRSERLKQAFSRLIARFAGKDAQKICVLVVHCTLPSGDEFFFSTELFPCLRREAYDNKEGTLEVPLEGRKIILSNAMGWNREDEDGLMLYRELACTYEDEQVWAFMRDPLWTQVEQME